MKRTYRAGRSSGKSAGLGRRRLDERRERASAKPWEEAIELGEVQLPLGPEALRAMLEGDLHRFAIDLGLLVAGRFLESEVKRLCGERYQRNPRRQHTRYGHLPGYVTLAGQKASLSRPRVRQAGGGPEVELSLYQALQSADAMPEAALKRMVRGVSTRNYEEVVEVARAGFGVKKSSVSRAFVKATAAAIQELSSRKLNQDRFLAIFLDGVEYARETMLVALGLTETGEKKILGLRQGASENAAVCTALLEELRERGLDTSQPILAVIDGSKALTAAVKRVWGEKARIQRCQIHKRRNIEAHLPNKHPRLSESDSPSQYRSNWAIPPAWSEQTGENTGNYACMAEGGTEGGAPERQNADRYLARIVAAWPRLSEQAKAAILAIVESAAR